MTSQPISLGDEGQLATRDLASRHATRVPGLRMLETLDRQFGGFAALPLEDTEDLLASLLSDAGDDPDLVLGIALWAIRHQVPIPSVEPVANALAHQSNEAGSTSELAAVFGLMQGVIANVAPRLAADLERSNPERPWRILHLNLAITAIRTEDEAMMSYAFDALDAALPEECAGFYGEALALALAPGIAPPVREQIERRHLKWTA